MGSKVALFGFFPVRRVDYNMELRKLHKLAIPAIAGAVAMMSFGGASALETKSSDVHLMGYPTTDAIEYMGGLLNSRTGGRINVKIFHSLRLGGEKEALEQVRIGALEMTRVGVGVKINEVPDTAPFIAATQVVRDELGKKFADLIKQAQAVK